MAWTNPTTRTSGELITPTIWNTDLVENLKASPHPLAIKSADQSVTSSIVLVNDTHLVVPLGATETWWVSFGMLVFGGNGNVRFNVTVPASATYSLALVGLDTGGVNVVQGRLYNTGGASPDITFIVATQGYWHRLEGLVWTAGTAGNLQLQWAQATSNATATTLKKGSVAIGMKVA